MIRVLAAAVLVSTWGLMGAGHAADLDSPYGAGLPPEPPLSEPVAGLEGHVVVSRNIVVEQSVPVPPPPVLDEVLTPARAVPAATGPYLYVPGLNGPSGPPVYPLLPYSFGYGY
jgi:hypothetical protein